MHDSQVFVDQGVVMGMVEVVEGDNLFSVFVRIARGMVMRLMNVEQMVLETI